MMSITINFDKNIDLDVAYNKIKSLFPDAEIKKNMNENEFDDFMLASKSSLAFWDNEIDDEVWNNV